MKKYTIFGWLCGMLALAGCFKDDSMVATEANRVGEIVITGLSKEMTAVAYGPALEITPVVEGFEDDELSYAWYVYGGSLKETPEGYRAYRIQEGKTLSYSPDLKIGTYTVVCEATHKGTGYFGTAEFKLNVTSEFSEGFYLLKETAEGNTELDFYNEEIGKVQQNLLQRIHGASIPGAPRNLNTVYGKVYMDPKTATSTYATSVFVCGGENEFGVYSTVDMSLLFDRSSLLYVPMDADEIPYAMASHGSNNYYFSNKGVRADNMGGSYGASEYATGQFGHPIAESTGNSAFVQFGSRFNFSYWNPVEKQLMYTTVEWDFSSVTPILPADNYSGANVPWKDIEPIASGRHYNAGENQYTVWWLFKTPTQERYLVFTNAKRGPKITEGRKLDAALHIARSNIVAGNTLQASVIYSVDGNQLYRYSLTDGTESPVTLTGLPEGEITYVSNQFYKRKFDYLVLGVQNGANYTVVMYHMLGGVPDGKPFYQFSGEGKLVKLCYACPTAGTYPSYNNDTCDFPY